MEREKLIQQYKKTPVTFILIGIIITYYLIISLNGGSKDIDTLIKFGALLPLYVRVYHEYYRLLTAVFIHIGMMHLIFNGYALYFFGTQMERLMGSRKFLAFFLLVGVGANIATYFLNPNLVSAGASGSLFGLLGAFVYLIQHHTEMITPQGRKSIFQLLGLNLLITLLVPNISVVGHFGGFAIGYFLSYGFIK